MNVTIVTCLSYGLLILNCIFRYTMAKNHLTVFNVSLVFSGSNDLIRNVIMFTRQISQKGEFMA